MATSAIDRELGGLRFFLTNFQDCLLESKDNEYRGSDIVALPGFQGLNGYKCMATSGIESELGGSRLFLMNWQECLLNGKDSEYRGSDMVALSGFQGPSGNRFMATSAVDFEISGLRFVVMSCPERLREGKDKEYWGGDTVALHTFRN
jgi:hypothetical protein